MGSTVTKGGRILVVDDETLVRDTVGSLLSDEGYLVDKASDGADAITKIAAHRPDAILLDLMMPGMNGRQFLDALRDLGHADVPVVVMTAVHGLSQDGGVRFGATDVIEKPFDLDELLNKVALAVYRSGGDQTMEIAVEDVTADAAHADPGAEPDRGVVLLIDRDRAALQRLDALLSARGYTVVSMTRVTAQLPRLAAALEPRAIILDVASGADGGTSLDVVRTLRETPGLGEVPILVFERAAEARPSPTLDELARLAVTSRRSVDEDLVRFVEET
ncbi:MAG: response regulator [Kofleriaceae bacterium]|nr:response regulator [Kofleriaceae bacterium]MCB9574370.1 response regulator [Kofleriaceae bacterium]